MGLGEAKAGVDTLPPRIRRCTTMVSKVATMKAV
jgi:hypothetical protein